MMKLSRIGNFTILKVVQLSHHQADARYGASRGIQCSCMSLMSINLILFKLPHCWDLMDLDSISQKGDELFKSISKFKCIGVEDLPHAFSIETCSICVDFLENSTGEITADKYLVSIMEIIVSF